MKMITVATLASLIAGFPASALARPALGSDQPRDSRYNRLSIKPSSLFVRALTRSAVREVQEALNKKGFDVGFADGVWGPRTASALREFQEQNRLQARGRLDRRTVTELGPIDPSTAAGSTPWTTGQSSGRR
jgi:peptidoglycan hydrolase-like protein with peptidoglycan-binding domain